MLKQVVLLKRRPGMTMAEFIDYYENHHSKMAAKYLTAAKRYVRRYVHPAANPITGEVVELDFDVVMELWWDSQEDFEAAMKVISHGDVHREFYEDEEKIFNTHNNRVFFVEEHD